MVYIANGTISESRPWSVQRVKDMIYNFFYAIYLFFMTLFGTLVPDNKTSSSNNRSNKPGGSGGGGPGSGGPGGGRGQPAGFSRRIGRVVNSQDCPMPGGG